MQPLDPLWLMGIGVFIAGAVVGAILYRLIAPAAKNATKLQSELAAAEQEMKDYKTQVTDHFNKTSNLVNELTQDYVKVYQHLADGAQSLGDPEKASDMLAQRQNKPLVAFAVEDDSIDPASREIISEAVKEAAEHVRMDGDVDASSSDEPDAAPARAGVAPQSSAEPGPADEQAPSAAEPAKVEESDDEGGRPAEKKPNPV